jgi:hypothetical protein
MAQVVPPLNHPTYRVAEHAPSCPRCRVAPATLGLLTTLVAYYRCERCAHHWQLSRVLASFGSEDLR